MATRPNEREPSAQFPRTARRIVTAVIGGTVLAVGIALVALPGPALLVIPLGLAILATEFVWARRFLRRLRERIGRTRDGAA